MTSIPASAGRTTSVALPATRAALWLAATTLLALAVYYFIGVDQGAASAFGDDMHVHEFLHDARHFLGFPCH
jgi:Probable cobalt transporter subunit (CbtB)